MMEKNQARSRLKPKKEFFLKKHLRYIFSLFVALIAYFLLYLLISKVYPSQIQNFLFKNSYLPFFLLTFIANFFFFTFLLLNKNLGLIIAFFINLVLYFKVLSIEFDFLSLLIIFLIVTALISLAFLPRLFYNRPDAK